MNLNHLKEIAKVTIETFKSHGDVPKENNLYDYKTALNQFGLTDSTEIFMRNFCKDILAFCNSDGGILILGLHEDKTSGEIADVGLSESDLSILQKIDLNLITQKFEKIVKVGVGLDLQIFQAGSRKFYCLVIEKQHQVLVPIKDFDDYKVKKGEIYYRASGKNELANVSTQDFNRFIQIKANERNKEFMEIWSRLLPEMFDINPREILMLNPKTNKIYGFNGKDNVLASSDIEIDKTDNGVFNVILNAISAGEIGRISDSEGKPLYKIIGEIKSQTPRESISLSTLASVCKERAKFIFSEVQLKLAMFYLGWVNVKDFAVNKPTDNTVIKSFSEYLWIEVTDVIKDSRKVVFSDKAIEPLVTILKDETKHIEVFGRMLSKKK